MANAEHGAPIPVYLAGRRALYFPANQDRSITYNFQAAGKTATVSGWPRLYWRMKYMLTSAMDDVSNITCQIGISTFANAGVLTPGFTTVTRYINATAYSAASIAADTTKVIALDLTTVFDGVTLGRSVDFDMTFMRLGSDAEDDYTGSLLLINSKIWWCPRTVTGDVFFATLAS